MLACPHTTDFVNTRLIISFGHQIMHVYAYKTEQSHASRVDPSYNSGYIIVVAKTQAKFILTRKCHSPQASDHFVVTARQIHNGSYVAI